MCGGLRTPIIVKSRIIMVLKQKRCKSCKQLFTPFSTMSKACSPMCAISLVKLDAEKRQRRKDKMRKDLLKSRGDWIREAQTAFNRFIRLRDSGNPCISCDKPDDGSHQRHASHYRSCGANPELRFNELNVWASCAQCNSMKSGNLLEYRIRLINKIGLDKVDWLEGPHEPLKLTIDQIKAIKKKYAYMARELEKQAVNANGLDIS